MKLCTYCRTPITTEHVGHYRGEPVHGLCRARLMSERGESND